MRKILSFIGIALAIACLLFVGDIFLEIYKEHPGFFSENSWLFWLYVLSMLTAVGMIFHRWLPQGRPRKTVVERTRNGRTLLFDKNEELQRVGFFDKIQGEFIVMFCVIALYMEDVIKGKLTGGLLFVVMSGIMWFISRPPY
ncbi:MAG: hypothetical protein LBF51_09365, partial [Zoogloeaceae bacterium]|nr:hypothetical protein [Zoogloeaceae bacterium]